MSSVTSDTAKTADAPSANKRHWGPLNSTLLVLIAFVLAQLFGYMLISIYPAIRHWGNAMTNDWEQNSISAQFLFVLFSEAVTLLILWLYFRNRITLKQIGLTRPSWFDPIYSVIAVIIYYGMYLLAVAGISVVVSVNTSQQQDIGFNNVVGFTPLLMTFVSLVVLPPIVEEITFRGVLFGGLRRKFNPVIAALITSCLFAAPHLLESNSGDGLLWIAGIDTFILSLVLCYLREKTGRLWAGMGVHALKNSVAFISLFIAHIH